MLDHLVPARVPNVDGVAAAAFGQPFGGEEPQRRHQQPECVVGQRDPPGAARLETVGLAPDRSDGPMAERDQNGAEASGRSGTNSDAGMALV